ncbi:MAG TPA: hypothetical protein VH229_08140 [Candidatus Udaeobacter sp.]|jgi:hypothetical protein|nr:hypothetical protein [Candidatus Udaeobacter sp.]
MSNNPSTSATGAGRAAAKGICFVIMGFGEKTDFETGRTLNLDRSYHNMIKPAIEVGQ